MQYVVHETDKKNKMQLKLSVEDGQYKEYQYMDIKSMKPVENQPEIHPVYNKLFNQDIIEIDNDTKNPLTMKILHSSVRSMKNICLLYTYPSPRD